MHLCRLLEPNLLCEGSGSYRLMQPADTVGIATMPSLGAYDEGETQAWPAGRFSQRSAANSLKHTRRTQTNVWRKKNQGLGGVCWRVRHLRCHAANSFCPVWHPRITKRGSKAFRGEKRRACCTPRPSDAPTRQQTMAVHPRRQPRLREASSRQRRHGGRAAAHAAPTSCCPAPTAAAAALPSNRSGSRGGTTPSMVPNSE